MTGEVVNLRMARKARARKEAAAAAATNHAKFGEAKSVRMARDAETGRATRMLDGNRREPD